MLNPGERLGDWIVDDILGEGGMGAVYRVHSALSDRIEAALKVMKPSLAADARARFVREAEALSTLRHPGIVRVMGFAEEPSRGLLYLVMELARGETLKTRLERGAMTLAETVGVFLPLASALEHAHAAGIYHRDLKPANIVLCFDGSVRLVDFGIAAATQSEALTTTGHVGTLSYLPPEVFRGQHADPHAIDVYGFGVLTYEALTGNRVFPVEAGLSPAAAAATVGVRKLQQGALELPASFPDVLRTQVRTATAPEPLSRPSMGSIREALETVREMMGLPLSMATAEATPSPSSWAGARPVQDRTTRVPEPTPSQPVVPRPRGGDRRRSGRSGPQSIGWIVAAVALSALVLLIFVNSVRRDRDEPGASPGPGTSSTAPGAEVTTPRRPSDRPGGSPPATTPIVVYTPAPRSPSPEGAFPLGEPTPAASTATPASTPLPISTPRPATPPPSTTLPAPVAPFRTPPPTTEVPDPGQPEDVPSDTESPPGRVRPAAMTQGGGVSGRWSLTNVVQLSSYTPFIGLQLGYDLTLRQEGNRIVGTGSKSSENGRSIPAAQRTPIHVTGQVDGDMVVLQFTEQGAERRVVGTFRWRLSGDALSGSFASDGSNGRSTARRVQ